MPETKMIDNEELDLLIDDLYRNHIGRRNRIYARLLIELRERREKMIEKELKSPQFPTLFSEVGNVTWTTHNTAGVTCNIKVKSGTGFFVSE